jgi:NTP pyrophosphatase (non-canonical NTP hydrolase)
MNKGAVKITGKVPLPCAVLWRFLMETPDWHPGTKDIKIEGDLKSFSNDDGHFVEQFTVKDYIYSYTFLESPYPLINYQASFQLKPLGPNECEIIWSSTFFSPLPKEESEKLVSDVYQGAIRFLQDEVKKGRIADCLLKQVEQQELTAKEFGFYWEALPQLMTQIERECREIEEAHQSGHQAHLQEEIGDLMHAAIGLAVFCQLDPKETLRKSIDKFQRRYETLVKLAQADGYQNLHGQPFSLLLQYWQRAKQG